MNRDLCLPEKLRTRGAPTLLLLIVTIGTLNVFLGFGLAMYFGYGPPGLDGIFQSLGPIPPAAATHCAGAPAALQSRVALGEPYILPFEPATAETAPPVFSGLSNDVAQPLVDEETVLSDVRELTAAAQATFVSGAAEIPE